MATKKTDEDIMNAPVEERVRERIPKNIYQTINAVMEDVGAIGKDSKNQAQGFMFRGIDAVMNALNPAMRKNKLFVVPRVMDVTEEQRATKNGTVQSFCRLLMEYDFVAEDGSKITASVVGLGADTGDKGYNKALSIAFKYACFQVFCIPTEEMKEADPDTYTPEPTVMNQGGKSTDLAGKVKVTAIIHEAKRKGVDEARLLQNVQAKQPNAKSLDDMLLATWDWLHANISKMPDVVETDINGQVNLGL